MENRPAHILVAENLGRITEARGIMLADVAARASIDQRELFAVLLTNTTPTSIGWAASPARSRSTWANSWSTVNGSLLQGTEFVVMQAVDHREGDALIQHRELPDASRQFFGYHDSAGIGADQPRKVFLRNADGQPTTDAWLEEMTITAQ